MCVLALLVQAAGLGAFAFIPSASAYMIETGGICAEVSADVVLAMDVSGSMNDGAVLSKCEWTEMKQVPGQEYYTWFLNTKYNVSEQWCLEVKDSFDESSPYYSYKAPTYTPAVPSKINAAKDAANSFLGNMGISDQSGLVSFAASATANKNLSADHPATQTAVSGLTVDTSGDATNIGEAIDFSNNELTDYANPQAVKAIILLTDGRANKPTGNGYGEDPADVLYAEAMAAEAAVLGYKIFTIGLGNSVNPTMLGNIASATGGKYYPATDGNDLDGIYTQIASDICGYGSISGCKYQDTNNDGEITEIEKSAGGLSGWEIVLSGGFTASQTTGADGCYKFAGLAAGNYTISEGVNADKEPYLQTYPESGFHSVTLGEGENKGDIDFGNADDSLCQLLETDRQCIGDGQAQVTHAYNYEYCGEGYTENVPDESCACQMTDTPGECSGDGFREHSFVYNYDYCGADYTDDIADESCGCAASELSRQCIGDNLAEITYTYNFNYCGSDYTETGEDLSCGSEYQCGEWQDLECAENGSREQTRTCFDQYQNSYEETREVSDETCACVSEEIDRICASDGWADVEYSWNYGYCGGNYTVSEEDTDCACIETEIAGECVDDVFREFTFTYNHGYCLVKDPELREDETCGSGGGEPEDQCVDSDSDGYFAYNEINCSEGDDCDDTNPDINPGATEICDGVDNNCDGEIDESGVCDEPEDSPENYGNEQDCADAGYYWYDEICNLNPEPGLECADSDGDGYYAYDEINCPEGDDCDDADPNINPGAEEVCDEVDNNCDGEIDEGGVCDTKESKEPEEEKPSGGGGGHIGGLAISGESVRDTEVLKVDMKITWTTSQFSTSQVIYDTAPGKFDPEAGAPNYGYAYSKEGDDSGLEKVTGHSVTLTGLNSEITYYYRTVSAASPPVFSAEYAFVSPVLLREVPQPSGTMEPADKEGEVKGTETQAECNCLSEYIKLNADNNSVEVEKLERFLNEFEGENLPVNGIYEQIDFDAVSRFQEKYSEEILSPWNYSKATGYVYITTKKKINELYSQKEFPLTAEQEKEIGNWKLENSEDVKEDKNEENELAYLPETEKEEIESEGSKKEAGEVAGAENIEGLDKDEKIVEDNGHSKTEETESLEEGDTTIMEALSQRWWLVLIIVLMIAGGAWYLKKEGEKGRSE